MNATNWPGLVRLIGILLIGQGIVRLGFITMTILQVPSDLLQNNPFFLVVSIAIPALLAAVGAGAGALMLQLMPAARSFGLVAISICLAYQLYAFGTGLYYLVTRPVNLSWQFWTLGPTFIALYVAAIAVLWRWQPDWRTP